MNKYIIQKSRNGQFYFVLTARNGQVILTSEMYTTKQNCLNGIASVKKHSPYDKYYNRKIAVNGQYFFTLHASNGQVIGMSEMYVSRQGRDNGISSVKENGPGSPVVDRTSQAA
ncbi:MAG: YegP family protein [bacterium]|nr:YegP family protein [bacterium]